MLRNHIRYTDGATAAVTDRGLRHQRNEDAVAIGSLPGGGSIMVVCDGVSSTAGAAAASLVAADTIRDVLLERLGRGGRIGIAVALIEAAELAQSLVGAMPEVGQDSPYPQSGPPSSTIAAAVAVPDGDSTEVTVAWLGDSRVYWIGDCGSRLLTEDHQVRGRLTRWLGSDSPDPRPDLLRYELAGQGRLVACSDGLWRYSPSSKALGRLVNTLVPSDPPARHLPPKPQRSKARLGASDLRAAPAIRSARTMNGAGRSSSTSRGRTMVEIAEGLVNHAVARGGHDNISVAIWESPRG